MERVYGEQLKKIQLEILDVVSEFCEQNDIKYWLDSGTLLGAIRHKGYIPWDDDIDIGMLREDYDKFCKLFNQKNERYKLLNIENTPGFHSSFGKVCDTSTLLYEPDESGFKLYINIDIFIYDNAPDNDDDLRKMYDVRDSLKKIYSIHTENKLVSNNFIKTIIKFIRRTFYRILYKNPDVLVLKSVENSKKFSTVATKRVGNFTAYTRMACTKDVFDSFIYVEFEGKKYKAPIGYDKWLRSFYGDYMKLPPKEKQVSHHSFVAYANEKYFKEINT